MYSCLSASPCLLHSICILTWKDGFLCVCFIHLLSGCTPWLECVYALVHVYMSTLLPMSTQTSLHSYMETWVPLCGSVFVSHSPHLCSLNLSGMCTCISICINANLSSEFYFIPYAWKHGCQCVALCMLQSSHFFSHTLFTMCTCISTCIYANLSSEFCSIPYV